MSHVEQRRFFELVSKANTEVIQGGRILEIGSYDVNGDVRALFDGCAEYYGVDLSRGPGVDIVGYGHKLNHPDGSFDATLCGECFEHDPYWELTFKNMVRMTRPGGLVVFTCASKGRPEHGTRRTTPLNSPGTQSLNIDYYRNLNESDFDHLPMEQIFSSFRFWYNPTHFDLYFVGIRSGGEGGALPSASAVSELAGLMPLTQRVARLPLRIASHFLTEPRYQTVIRPYWSGLRRMATMRPSDGAP